MIQIKNCKVGYLNAESSTFYEDILKEQPKKPSLEKIDSLVDEEKTKSYTPLYASLVVLIVLVGAFLSTVMCEEDNNTS